MLSGDSLRWGEPDSLQDTLLDNTQLVVQYADSQETNEQVGEQVPAIGQVVHQEPDRTDSLETDLCQPLLTLAVDEGNNEDDDAEAEGTLTVVAEAVVPPEISTNGPAVPTEDDSTPICSGDVNIGVEYATSIDIRGPPADTADSLITSYSSTYATSDEFAETSGGEGSQSPNAPDLPGLVLVNPDISSWEGQIIYLDFDGEEVVIYDGPVTVGPFDVPAFQAPGQLAGQEQAIMSDVLARLESIFANSGVVFTTTEPLGTQPYSTIHVGGDGSAFAEYGSFSAIASQVDLGNKSQHDTALVFSEQFAGYGGRTDDYIARLTDAVGHEAAHLLGYAHFDDSGNYESLAAVGASLYFQWFEVNGQRTTSTSGTFTVKPNQQFWIYVDFENRTADKPGGINISLPGFSGTVISRTWYSYEGDTQGTRTSNYYPVGSAIWHRNGYQITSTARMVEGYDTYWESGDLTHWYDEDNILGINVQAPSTNTTFYVYVRAWLNNTAYGSTIYEATPASASYIDQQGYYVYRYTVNVYNAPPSISSLSDSPDPVARGNTLTLTANSVTDPNGTVNKVEFYRDTNNNGVLDVGTDTLLGTDISSSGGWTWNGSTSAFPLGTNRYFARAQDNNGAWSNVVSTTGTVNNAPPTIGSLSDSPDPVTQGNTLTLTANSVTDPDGTVSKVEFYRDSNNNGVLDVGIDTLLGADTSSSGGWTWSGSTGTFAIGTNRYFARAQDNNGAWSNVVSATGAVATQSDGKFMVAAPWQYVKGQVRLPVILIYKNYPDAYLPNLNYATVKIGPAENQKVVNLYSASGSSLNTGGIAGHSIEFSDGTSDYYEIRNDADWWYTLGYISSADYMNSSYWTDIDPSSGTATLPVEITYAWKKYGWPGADRLTSAGCEVTLVTSMPSWSGTGYGWYAGDTHFHSALTDTQWADSTINVEFGTPTAITRVLADAMDLDWVTITDHSYDLDTDWEPFGEWFRAADPDVLMPLTDYSATPSEYLWSQLQSNPAWTGTGLSFLKGEEISIGAGHDYGLPTGFPQLHLLAYGFSSIAPYVFAPGAIGMLPLSHIMGTLANIGGMMFAYAAHPTDENLVFGEPWTLSDVSTALGYDNGLGESILRGFEFWNGKTDTGWDTQRNNALSLWESALASIMRPIYTAADRVYQWFLAGGSDDHLSHYVDGGTRLGDVRTVGVAPSSSSSDILSAFYNGHTIVTDGPWFTMGVDMNSDADIWDFGVDAMPGDQHVVTTPSQGILRFAWPDQTNTPWHNPSVANIRIWHYDDEGNRDTAYVIPGSSTWNAYADWSPAEDGTGWQCYRAELVMGVGDDAYTAYSNPIWLYFDVQQNLPPTIGSLSDAPDPVARGNTLTLTANSVADPDGTVSKVEFYRDSNNNGVLDVGTDTLLGADTSSLGGWSLPVSTSSFPLGTNRYFARAQDNNGAWSNVVSTTGTVNSNVPPTIGSLSDSPDPVTRGNTLTLTANSVTDPDGTVSKVEFYRDSNNNGVLDVGTDTLLGADTSSLGGWSLAVSTSSFPLGTNRYFARAQDNSGAWSNVVSTTGTVNNGPPAIGSLSDSPDPVTQGNTLTLTANSVTDLDGTVSKVEFYRDSNNNGVLDVGTDTLLGADTSSSGGWSWAGSTAAFPLGTNRYFARAQDNNGAWSNTVSTTGIVVLPSTGDPNDQISEAIATSVGNTVSGTISPTGTVPDPGPEAGDVDMFRFTVSAGQRVGFDIDRPSGSLDSYIRLFDSNGNPLAGISYNDDGAAPGEASSFESYLEYTFAAGTYYIGVSGYNNSAYSPTLGTGDVAGSTGAYTLILTNIVVAPGDPNDQISEAILTSVGSTVTGQSISPTGTSPDPTSEAGDVDMYRFTVSAGQRVAFDIDRPSGTLDSYIRLFDSSGNPLAGISYNDDGAAPGEAASLESYLEYTFATTGTYYLAVSGYNNSTYSPTLGTGDVAGSTGAYTLILTNIVVGDPNDTLSQAIATSVGSTVTGNVISPTGTSPDPGSEAGDVDMFRFTVSAGQRVGFDIDRPSGTLDSYIRLFNSSGTQLASNDDGAAPGEAASLESYLEYTFATAGTYYLAVSGYNNSTYSPTLGTGDVAGSTGAYTLSLRLVDPNDQISEAIITSVGSTVTGQLISPTGTSPDPGLEAGDVDMFRFTVSAGQRVGFDIDRPSGTLDSYIRLFNSSGTQLASNDDGAAPGEAASLESYLEYTFATAGTYYLGVSGYNNSTYSPTLGTGDVAGSTGAYTLSLRNIV